MKSTPKMTAFDARNAFPLVTILHPPSAVSYHPAGPDRWRLFNSFPEVPTCDQNDLNTLIYRLPSSTLHSSHVLIQISNMFNKRRSHNTQHSPLPAPRPAAPPRTVPEVAPVVVPAVAYREASRTAAAAPAVAPPTAYRGAYRAAPAVAPRAAAPPSSRGRTQGAAMKGDTALSTQSGT